MNYEITKNNNQIGTFKPAINSNHLMKKKPKLDVDLILMISHLVASIIS